MAIERVAAIIGVAFLTLVANVSVSILYMVLYGHVIDPGHEPSYYQEHIQVTAPYCSIVAGIPLMFMAGWWVAGWWQHKYGVKSAIGVWFAYFVIDLAVILASGITFRVAVLFFISFATKFVAVWYGASRRIHKTT